MHLCQPGLCTAWSLPRHANVVAVKGSVARRSFCCQRPAGKPACRPLPAGPDDGVQTSQSPRTTAGVSDDAPSQSDAWQRLSLLRRQMDVAVAEEDFKLAARLRDDSKTLVGQLPPVQQYLYRQAQTLRTGTTTEKLKAIATMAETGDSIVVPDLANCLSEPDLQEATQAAMWTLFMRNSDPEINELMVEGVTLMNSPTKYEQALKVFTTMVERAPHFAEGYNKRATVYYLMRRFEDSIQDCKMVLKMQPWHFGAASGMGLCYLMLNRDSEAIEAFELSLRINPALANISKVLTELRKKAGAGGAARSGRRSKSSGEEQEQGEQDTQGDN